MNKNQIFDAKNFLNELYKKRKARNKSYSRRALSRDIGINRTTTSEVMRGEREMSKTNVNKLIVISIEGVIL